MCIVMVVQYTNVGCTAGETLLQHQKQQQQSTETKFLKSPPQTSGKSNILGQLKSAKSLSVHFTSPLGGRACVGKCSKIK
jgi:hypothetical protein